MTNCCKKVIQWPAKLCCTVLHRMEPGWLSRYSDWLGLDIPGPESRRVTDAFSTMSRPALGPPSLLFSGHRTFFRRR